MAKYLNFGKNLPKTFVEGRTCEEIDFLLIKKKKVCPIEVKSSGYKTHKSFDFFIQKYPIKVKDRYIIYSKDFKYEDGITYIPFYMAMCL